MRGPMTVCFTGPHGAQDCYDNGAGSGTPAPTPAGLKYSLSCTANRESRTKVNDYKAAWAKPFDLCTADSASGAPSTAEKAAIVAAGYDSSSPDGAK